MKFSKQRVLDAANHKQPDRVPITFDAEVEVYETLYKHFNLKQKEELYDRLNVDTWMVLPKNFIYPKSDINQIEKTSLWGYKTKYTQYEGGAYDELFFSPLAGKDDLSSIDKYQWPKNSTLGFSHYPAEIKLHGERAIIGVFTWGAYFIATFVRGIEDLMIDFALRKKYAHHLINTIADRCYYFLDKMLTECGDGIDIVYMADDYCSQLGPFFSPDAFKEFVVPYLKRFVDRVHQADKKFLLHVCGSVRPLLPHIINCGVDMLEPIQTRAAGMRPEGLKRDFGKDICFYGGMDLQQILNSGTVQQVKDEAKRLIDILGKDGGYIFGPGHTYIQVDAPIENILAMYEMGFNYRSLDT
jgi:uroporphyrinogen decarboxylase